MIVSAAPRTSLMPRSCLGVHAPAALKSLPMPADADVIVVEHLRLH